MPADDTRSPDRLAVGRVATSLGVWIDVSLHNDGIAMIHMSGIGASSSTTMTPAEFIRLHEEMGRVIETWRAKGGDRG